jgi:ribosomal protein L40E
VSTKICPNCNAEVPSVAHLCKHCFHDFHLVAPKRKSPLFPVLLFAAGSAIVSAIAYGYMHDANRTYNISLDQETESIVFTTVYADRTEADRVYWKDVSNIEYVKNTAPRPFEVAVVTTKGERFIYMQGDEPLDYQATQLGDSIKHPVITRDESGTPDVANRQ